ncbi:hypothetical protein LHJ74_25890 [Streptomyces sp. N2-109]|uniref:Uncharacterized protein n=1 Tax=Streptomyces gossypii TaxID=2883101 RepID=A0ABT2JZG0_9ACTN|nr:hypothetical protein [Streptomyces gossypii]MCT2593295.1 hypothetical protein [Streptomyces gossypii]
MTKQTRTPGFPPAEPESLAQLRGDCARMAQRWPAADGGAASADSPGSSRSPASPEPHGVRVPPRSARLVDGMSEYGD